MRRLLAESAGPEPVPTDVAARLDATLARLVEQRDEPGAEVETLALGSPGRRRWPKLLLAAAAVIVAGYGIGTVVQNESLSGDNASSTSEGAGAAQSAPEADKGQALADQRNPDRQLLRVSAPVRLHSAELRGEVRRLLGRIGVANGARLPKAHGLTSGAKELRSSGCTPGEVPPDSRWLPATYDGHRAVLVLGPPRRSVGDHSVVAAEVHTCSGRLLDSATVVVG